MTTMRSFPVDQGLKGIDSLAVFLNGQHLKGQWHFASGTRFNLPLIHVDFDEASDAEPALQGYQAGRFIGPPNA